MNTKTILLAIVFMTSFLGFSDKTYADNTIGNVMFDFWPNNQTKQATMRFYWNDNQSSVTPIFYWDTIPNSYRFKYEPGIFTSQSGNVEYQFSYLPCHNYFGKVQFTDGSTANSYQLFNWINTPGDRKPEIKNVNLFEIGFNYLKIQLNIDGHCEGFETRIYCQKMGESPILRYNEQNGSISNLNLTLEGLIANTQYQLTIEHENWLGITSDRWTFMTPSNLPPSIESTGALDVREHNVLLNAYLDTKNTKTMWRMEWGKDILFDNYSNYNIMYNGESSVDIDINGLEPNTVYYWRPFAKNDFGTNAGQTRMFKTNGNTTGIQELTFDDLLRVSKSSEGISIYVEQKAEVRITNINGQVIGTYTVTDKLDINDLPAGIYIAETTIGGKHLVKKFMF